MTLSSRGNTALKLNGDGGKELIGYMPHASSITFSAAAGGSNICNVTCSNICNVTCTVVDPAGNAVAEPFLFDIWLSDASTGVGHTATSASGTVTNKSASGLVVDTQVSKKALLVQTLATGVFVLEITDSAKTAFYVCARVPGRGHTVVSTVLATANYG